MHGQIGKEQSQAKARQLGCYLEELFVVVGRGPFELSLEGVHDGEMIGGEVVVVGSAVADKDDKRNQTGIKLKVCLFDMM